MKAVFSVRVSLDTPPRVPIPMSPIILYSTLVFFLFFSHPELQICILMLDLRSGWCSCRLGTHVHDNLERMGMMPLKTERMVFSYLVPERYLPLDF